MCTENDETNIKTMLDDKCINNPICFYLVM